MGDRPTGKPDAPRPLPREWEKKGGVKPPINKPKPGFRPPPQPPPKGGNK